jgi:Oxidoreductase family, NAD-binding Rossmann fold
MTARRRFIAQAAATAVAPFISTTVTRARAAASKKKLGFAICGLGGLSSQQVAPALQKTANCRLAAVITDTPAKAASWQAQYDIADRNIYTYDTMQRMADNPDIDVVYIVTPNALHLDNALAAAKADKRRAIRPDSPKSKSLCCGRPGSPAGRSVTVAPATTLRRPAIFAPWLNTVGLVWIRPSTTTASGERVVMARLSTSLAPISLRWKWMTSRNAFWKRSRAGCRAKKDCVT